MGRDSSFGVATRYGLDGLGIESQWPSSRSKVCGRSLAGVAGSNPAGGGWGGCLCCVCCTVRTKGKNARTKKYG